MLRCIATDDVAITEEFEAIYDAWNRLVELKYEDKTYYRYEYDGLNRRVRKIEYNSAGTAKETITASYYNRSWQLLEEYINDDPEGSGTDELAYAYVWGKRYIDDLVMRVDYTSDSSGGPVVNQTLYALQDSKYNVAALYDADSDTVVERYEYTAYGECTVMDSSYNPRTSSSGDNQSLYDWSIRYSGYRFDEESGLYYVRYRSYHPQLGRWLQQDPIEYKNGFNLYAGYFAMHGGLDPLGLETLGDAFKSLFSGGFSTGRFYIPSPPVGPGHFFFEGEIGGNVSQCCHPDTKKVHEYYNIEGSIAGGYKMGTVFHEGIDKKEKTKRWENKRNQEKWDRDWGNTSGGVSLANLEDCPEPLWFDRVSLEFSLFITGEAVLAGGVGLEGSIGIGIIITSKDEWGDLLNNIEGQSELDFVIGVFETSALSSLGIGIE